MNEEKTSAKPQKPVKSAHAKAVKSQEKKAEQSMPNELSESQSALENSINPNVTASNSDRALH